MESSLHRNPVVPPMRTRPSKRHAAGTLRQKMLMAVTLLLLLSGYAKAQNAANYIFTPTTGTYTDLAGGTVVTALHADDGLSASLPLNFNFVFCGTTYTSVKVCSNGWINLGAATTSNVWTNSASNLGSITPVLMPLWDDLGGQSGVGSQASYATTGTAPNRVFTFEWKNWRWQVGGGSAISFQAKLYETTNVIEYIYRQETGSLSSPSASIGIANSTTDFQVLNNTTASPATFTANFDNYTSLSTKPATNQVYRFSPPPPCSAKPAAGTVNNLTPCPNKDFPLALTGTSIVTGLAYNWQATTTPAVPGSWNSTGILNPTQAIATGNINVPTWFRCIVTCTNTGQADTSQPSLFNLSSFLYCYCIPTYSSGGSTDNIVSVKLKNLLNNTTGNASPYYHDYTSQQPATLPIPKITQGVSDTVTLQFGSDGNQYNGVWIDFNRNGTFETSEFFTSGTNAGGNGTAKVVFTTPLGGPIGITRMRIRGGDDSQPFNTQPCGPSNSTWGEAEDYFVEIQYPPCNGPVDAGIAYISDTASCIGYSILLTDTTHEHFRSGIAWNWQESFTNGSTWSNIANSAGKDTLTRPVTAAAKYRLRMICGNTGDTTYSNVVGVNIKAPYKCYCYSMATGGGKDSTDVGAFAIGNFLIGTPGGPHLRNPDAIAARTDYTDLGPVQLFADTTYETDVFQIMRGDYHGDARITLFMDFNNNLQYDIPQERVVTGYTTINDWYKLFYVTIPANVITDVPTGMRLIINSNTGPNVPSDEACGPYVSGETEDYVVVFKQRPNLGITNTGNITALQLYPNPTDGMVTVSMNTAKPVREASIVITDITGRTVYTEKAPAAGSNFTKTIDLSGQARGMYLLTITADGEKMTRKLTLR